MSIPGSASPLFLASTAAAEAYDIPRSIRFNSGDSSYLNRTPSSAGNRQTWTWSGWVKKSEISNRQYIFTSGITVASDSSYFRLFFQNDDVFYVGSYSANYIITDAVFRDPSAWYHIVIALDTSNATAADRCIMYVNGVRQSTSGGSTIPQNAEYGINSTESHNISGDNFFNGYLADIHFIDGQALAASDFGEYDDSNVWQPIAFAGTYGTNGFHLDFSDTSSNSALGTDSSGEGNDWSVNNLSVAAGAGNDALRDSPVNGDPTNDTGAGGELSGNYATLNPLSLGNATLSNGNLDCSINSGGGKWGAASTIGVTSGKFYIEVKCVNNVHGNTQIGVGDSEHISKSQATEQVGTEGQAVYYRSVDGNKRVVTNGSASDGSYGNTYTQNDIIGIALNADDQEVTFYKNNTAQNSGTAISIPTTSQAIFLSLSEGGSAGPDFECNFGQRSWAYAAPSNYKALCTANLPEPTIADGSTAFDTVLYTGDGNSTQTITGLNFAPDLTWQKIRNLAGDHGLTDSVRGVSAGYLKSNSTDLETGSSTNGVSAFTSDGFTAAGSFNTNNNNWVTWAWDGGSSTVTNTDGSISSQVRANPSAGFSIVSYTGNGTKGSTIGHGLNAAPDFVLCKRTDASEGWRVGHVSPGWTTGAYLHVADGFASTANDNWWNNTAPTNSVITLGTYPNTSTGTYICYAFTPVEQYSSFGSYLGNGSTDGPFVYTGFASSFVMIKNASVSGPFWTIFDNKRGSGQLYPNEAILESWYPGNITDPRVSSTSNGFKVNVTQNTFNGSGNVMLYAAFAEHPFKTARAR